MGPLYKVGDKVEVIARAAEPDDYRFAFVDSMTRYTGRIVTIIFVTTAMVKTNSIPDDGYQYRILEDGGNFNWTSSMFRPLPASTMSQSSGDTPVTIKIKVKTNQIKFNFKN